MSSDLEVEPRHQTPHAGIATPKWKRALGTKTFPSTGTRRLPIDDATLHHRCPRKSRRTRSECILAPEVFRLGGAIPVGKQAGRSLQTPAVDPDHGRMSRRYRSPARLVLVAVHCLDVRIRLYHQRSRRFARHSRRGIVTYGPTAR
jgi:hypothetical protein